VYREPYAKSFARDFHRDSIETDDFTATAERRVHFHPFVGVAPRRDGMWFGLEGRPRKTSQGQALVWVPTCLDT
jgi:hypothetical protein